MSFFDEYNKTTTTKKGTTPEVTPKGTPAVAPTGSFYNEFTTKKDTVAPVVAPVVAPTETPISSLPRETISAPTGNEVLPVFDRIKDFTEKLLGINQKRTPADIIKDQQKAFESLVKNPSVQDTVDEFGNPVSPFKSVQTAREVRRSSIPTLKGIVEGLTDVSKSDVPFAGALLDAKDVGNVYLITQKLNNGKQITPEETVQLRDFFEKQDTLNKRRQGDAGYRVGEGLRNSLTFMAELGGASFVAPETGGTSIGGLIAEKGTLKATKEIATKMLADSVTRDLMTKQLKEYGIKAGQRSAVILGSQAGIHVPEDALTRMVGTPTFSNDMGSINVSVANDGQNVSDALINAFTGSLIETTSEFTGGIFEVLPKAVKNQLIKSAIIKATLEKNPGLSTNVITEFFKKAGWHGVIGEMGEEQIGNIMYGIANQMGVSDTNFHVPTAKELAEQFVSFSLMGGFIKTLSTGYQKVIKDNVQKDLPKDVKDLTETLHGVVSTGVNTDTPSDVVRALKDAGIDQNTAVKIVMEHADNQGQVDITPEALQAEIDAFMGTAPSEEDITTPPVVTETSKDTQESDTLTETVSKKQSEDMPFDLPSMDIPKEDLPKAEKDWSDNYQESYSMKQEDLKTLQKQLKNAKGESKRTTQARISTISEQLKDMETEFLNKHAPEQAQELEELQGGEVTAETTTKLENNYREEKDDNTPTFSTADFNDTFDENPVIFKKDEYVVGRDGRVKEVVSGNDNWKKEDPNYGANIGYLRTRDIGSENDYMDYANQVRHASSEEIAQAQEYAKNNPIKEDTMANIEKEAKVTKKKTQKDKVKEVVEKNEEVAKDITKPRVEGAVPKSTILAKGTKVSFEENGKTLTGEVKTSYPDNTTSVDVDQYDVVGGVPIGRISVMNTDRLKVLDNAGEVGDNKDDEQGTRSNQISNPSEVPTGADLGRSSKTTSEVSGYDRAAMLVQPRNGLGAKGTNGLTKSQRQLINQEVEGLLEAKNYSSNPDDYTETDKDLMRAYSGAGGKESVGGEGQGLLNEYYTPQEVVTTLWNIAERLSPNAETAFEPSAGTGRIISLAPASIKTDGAEISKVSGTIAQVLNPDSNITIGDFQELFFDKKTNKAKTPQQYDVVIGNPPFGERAGFLKGKGEEKDINRQEEYFIKRGLDMTKEGGHLIYVVNSSFLKTSFSKGKDRISDIGELVIAYRLPENTFEDTSIGTDIVVFKKNSMTGLPSSQKDRMSMNRQMKITGDNYFQGVTESANILGSTEVRKNRFGQTETYVKGDLATAMERLNNLLPEAAKTIDVVETPVIEENKPVLTKKSQESPKTTKKEGKVAKKDTQSTLPKENATELVTPAQDISNRKTTNPVEIQMLKRIDRDMSIPTPSSEEMKYLNVGKDNKMYPDAIYFSGEVVEKLEDLKKNKKTVVENYGEAQYEKQLKGLENAVPAIFPLKDIIFDPIDRHIAQINVGSMKKFGHYGQEVEGTLLMLFTNYVRNNDVAMSPRVTKYDITRYVNGEQAAKDTKPIMGSIKSDAKRLFNHFIKHELDATIQKGIEEKYNREKNGYVNPDYSQIPVEVQDMAKQFRGDDFKMSQTQKNGVGFLVNKGSGLIAYGVGVGKTHTLAIATKANMDKGWTKRPLFTVPKTTISKTWIGTLHEMFPTLKINNLEGLQAPVIARLKKERGEDPKNWIEDGEFTVISHEGLLRLGFKEDELRDAAGDLQDAIWKDESTKRAKEGQKNKFDEILGNAQKYVTDVMLSDLGFDHVSVDEVHNFRKIFQGAKPENVDENGNAVGRKRYGNVVGGTPSKRAQQLFLISQFIQKKNNNRNVFLASATPFENHATEVYNILSLVARDRMKQMSILNINDFFSVFANFEVELDRKLNGEWLNSEKMKSFSNVQALQSLIKEFIDYQEDPTLVRPERRVITPHLQMSAKQEENLAKIQNLLAGTKEIVNDTQAFDEDSKTMYDVSSEGAEDGAFLKASTYSIANSVSPYFIKEYAGTVTDAKTLVEDSPKIKYTLETLKTLKEDPKTKDFGTFVFFGKMGVEYHPMIAEYFAKELGYERNQVAHLSGSVTDEQKEDIKERFNKGEIKVLLGGDQTKEGIDLQNNGFVTINLALGWNPTQIAQVEGRVWRQGNRRSIAPLVYPLVENSGDAMIYNKFEEKGGRINDLFSYAGTMFDVGEIDPAEKKLSLLTDPKDKAKMQIEIDKTILYNERVMIDNDMKALQKLRGDLNQSREDVTYYKKEVDGLKDMSYMTEERKAEKAKDYKKEIKNAEGRVERIEAKLKEKNITDLNVAIGEMEGQMLDIDNKIKEIDKTYEPLLEKFTAEYRENIKKRKTLSQHMDEIKGLISELKERTPEEIKQLRNQKIAELDAIKNATPEFQRVEDTAEDVVERAKLREDATILMLDMQHSVGTQEERNKRYSDLMKRWEMLGRPEFQRTETTKEPTISFDAGKKRIEAYQKRLGLNFPVDFADVIFTGEYKNGVIPVKAYGVTYNDKITLTDNIKLTTADHEMVHIVVDNIDKIDAFKGITKEQLLLAQNKGKAYTEKDYERLNEELAIGFQKKVLGEEQSNVPMVIRNFYNKLQILLTDLFRALGGEANVIKDFYNKMAVAKSNSQVNLTSSPILDRRAQYERNGVKGLDFSFQTMKEMDDIRRAGFERIVEIAKDYSIDLKRKDINYIENLFAISRDLYLKDPVEFKQADEFMKIGDSRRMKKEILDVKFSEMLAPYYDLSKNEQTDVNAVLMQGDRDTKEYTEEELLKSNLTPAQIRAYFAVRRSFNTAHQLLIDEMERTGVKAEEIETFKKERRGYMPHKWKYRFAIKTQTLGEGQDPLQKGNWKTQTMDVYETAGKANKVFEQLKKDNKDPEHVRYVNDTLDAVDVDFFSEQRFSFENMKSMIAKAKTGNEVKDEMISAMRDVIKEKGFGRHFIKRTGIEGYETKDVPEIMANYFTGLNGFITKMEAGKQYYGVLEKIDARRQKNFYAWIRDAVAYDMGNTQELNWLKKVAFVYALSNDMSFLLTNATQNWVVGVGELTKLYKNNASKIAGAEATLMKATCDWAIGNISPEEKMVIEGLLKVGRLGGEMTSELMGFKNNPFYNTMGSWINTALYKTTAFVEQNVNRVPAFLSARRILKAQGLTDKEANEQALKVSDDINFRGGKQHRPVFMRGKLGTIFVFNTYIRSFLYQLSRDLKEKEFISLTKKMFYTTLLGGTAALPFAELIMKIVKALLPPDDEETKDELNTWEYALKKGPINAFLNVDISSRVNINVFGVSNIIKDPLNMLSWIGAIGGIGKRVWDGGQLLNQDRYLEAFGKIMPDFIGNPLRAYNGAMYGVTTASGNPLIDENGEEFKYTTYEGWVKAFGYSPARESIAWDEMNKQWVAKDEQSAKSSVIQGKIKRQIREGDIEGAKETQAEGLLAGDITDKSTDYVKKAVVEQTMRAKYEAWNTGTKSRPVLDKMERDIAKEIYGDKYTKLQLTNVTRDFAFYRTFGFENTLANEINKAQSTAEKVEILKKARQEMTLEEFKAFFNKGRTVVKYEATSKGSENTGYVLISDSLRKAYFAK